MKESNKEKEEIIESLRLFNEKYDKLMSLGFVKKIFEEKIGFTMSVKKDAPVDFQRHGPEGESIDAFVLTYRFFIQNNERISFQNMSEIYGRKEITQDRKEAFKNIRETINNFLDSNSILTINDKTYTHREIQDIFVYGGLSHANKAKKRIFDSWKRNQLLFGMLEEDFVGTLATILNAIQAIARLNLNVLKDIEDGT
ncbi:MAG: hypothetical protein WBC40_07115 [Halobacteriota archaeon]